MRRIYIDTNTFTRMRTKQSEKYIQLEEYLRKYSSAFFFPYSQAHIDDLSNDATNNKDLDLEFIESFSSIFLMTHHYSEGLKYQLASPKEVMSSKLESNSQFNLSEILSDFENDDNPISGALGKALKNLLEMPIHNIEMDLEKLRPQDLEMINKIVPGINKSFSISDMFTQMQKLNEELSDKKKFKDFRRYNLENLPGFNTLKDVSLESINNILLNSALGKNLNELIEQQNSDGKATFNQKVVSCFMILNLFGLDQESNKKANFISLSNDAQHAFYAGYCDVLISEDEGLRTKAKILYQNYGIATSIYSIDDFLKFNQSNNFSKSLSLVEFINALKDDVIPQQLINSYESTQFNRITSIYSVRNIYFDYFDWIEYIDDRDTGKAIVLRPKNSYGLFYEEVRLITNKIVASFGVDSEQKGDFSDSDLESIKNGTWVGRIWALPRAYINLEINKGTQQLCLCVILQ